MSDIIQRAQKALSNFCNGKQTLTVPPQKTDDDMVLQEAINQLSQAKELLAEKDAEIERLKEKIEELDYCQKTFYEATKKVGW